jgi:bacterial/archaeal transporter family-2 protein
MKWTWIIIALISGAFLPIQAGLNTRLGKSLESPVHASLLSFIVGAFAVLVYATLTKQHVSWAGLRTAPVYVWIGGFLGAFYVTAVILAFPRIGPALTFGLVVAGQMVISVLLDHFNVLVSQQHPINTWRILGIILIIAGVVIVRKF